MKLMTLKLPFIFALLLALSACNEFNAPTKKLTVAVETVENIHNVDKVLMARFHKYPTSTFASIDSHIKDKTIVYTFNRGIPEEDLLRYLVETKGQFIAYINKDNKKRETVLTNTDIVNSSLSFDEVTNSSSIQLSLSEAATKKMMTSTAKNIGKVITLEVDSERLSQATIRGVLGKHVQISSNKSALETARISALLGTGALPEKVQFIGITEDN